MRQGAEATTLEGHFEFGANWEKLLPQIDETRVAAAAQDIARFMERASLTGLSFLDVGCGSGLSSLAAYKLGAGSIISVDIDPVNVANAERLKKKFAVPAQYPWQCFTASIVGSEAQRLPNADIVYAWGVLHHTGAMWNAIDNCARVVEPNGFLYLMLYRDAVLAPVWRAIKRTYTQHGPIVKWVLRNSFAAVQILGLIAKGRNPRRVMREYPAKSRGMSWYVDSTDWIGGYPFEFAAANEVVDFLAAKGFRLRKISPEITPRTMGWRGTGSYQYLFVRDR